MVETNNFQFNFVQKTVTFLHGVEEHQGLSAMVAKKMKASHAKLSHSTSVQSQA